MVEVPEAAEENDVEVWGLVGCGVAAEATTTRAAEETAAVIDQAATRASLEPNVR